MRLLLEIKTGEHSGHKKWLRRGERMLVGRTEQSEFVVPDARMSSVHFHVECTAEGCRVRDMRSTNGTYLNGKRIAEDILHHGDTVTAGDTQFGIEITEDTSSSQPAEEHGRIGDSREWATLVRRTVPVSLAVMDDGQAGGLQLGPLNGMKPTSDRSSTFRNFRGDQVGEVAQRLNELSPLYLILEFAKIGRGLPASLAAPAFLYDWLPEQHLAGFSPVVIAASAGTELRELLELGWGHDCLVGVCSSLPGEELVQRLRALTRTDDPQQPRRKYASPATLAGLLSRETEEFANKFFDAVDAVLFESDNAEVCRVHTSPDFAPKLKDLKIDIFVPVPASEEEGEEGEGE
jgi:hypothetical protein